MARTLEAAATEIRSLFSNSYSLEHRVGVGGGREGRGERVKEGGVKKEEGWRRGDSGKDKGVEK